MQASPELSQGSIDRFLDALWIEDRLAKSSLDAYRRDLVLYAHWLARDTGCAIENSREADLFMTARHAGGR